MLAIVHVDPFLIKCNDLWQLDYYDVSLEVLAVYLQSFPDSAIAVNLKACNHFRLYNGMLGNIHSAAFHAVHDATSS